MWRYTTSVDYAIKILICLAKEKRSLSSSTLANFVATSPRYVLYICKKLKDAGMILAVYGINGGFLLQKEPSDINLYDILVAMGQNLENMEYSLEKGEHHYFKKLSIFHREQKKLFLSNIKSTSLANLI